MFIQRQVTEVLTMVMMMPVMEGRGSLIPTHCLQRHHQEKGNLQPKPGVPSTWVWLHTQNSFSRQAEGVALRLRQIFRVGLELKQCGRQTQGCRVWGVAFRFVGLGFQRLGFQRISRTLSGRVQLRIWGFSVLSAISKIKTTWLDHLSIGPHDIQTLRI